jgi:serine phosphatase RsbU (regulator of sigma subunit)
MMMAQTAIHTTLASNPALKPSALLAAVNRTLTRNIRSIGEDKYVTVTVLAALADGHFTFAGPHLDLLVYRAALDRVENVETRGVWLGILDEIDGMLHDDAVALGEGDLLLLYTDGVTEAWRTEEHGDRELFGEARLRSLLQEHGAAGPTALASAIVAALEPWTRPDDVTFLAVRRTAEPAPRG